MPTTINGTTGVNLIQDGTVQQADLAANVAGSGPCFSAYQNSGQVFTGVWAKVSLPVESYDLTNAFDATTNYRFQPTVAGYYQLNGRVLITTSSTSLMTIGFYKNGAIASQGLTYSGAASFGIPHSDIIYLNGSSDYVELWFYGSGTVTAGAISNSFSGFLARSA